MNLAMKDTLQLIRLRIQQITTTFRITGNLAILGLA
jgi:hypothetical protein